MPNTLQALTPSQARRNTVVRRHYARQLAVEFLPSIMYTCSAMVTMMLVWLMLNDSIVHSTDGSWLVSLVPLVGFVGAQMWVAVVILRTTMKPLRTGYSRWQIMLYGVIMVNLIVLDIIALTSEWMTLAGTFLTAVFFALVADGSQTIADEQGDTLIIMVLDCDDHEVEW